MTDTIPRSLGLPAEGLVPPQAIDAERAVLAAMLLDHEAVGRTVEQIQSSAFYRVAHQKVFDAIVAIFNRNERADLVTLADELHKRGDLEAIGGEPALLNIVEYAATSANQDKHIRIVLSKAMLRALIRSASEIQQEAYAAADEAAAILDRAEHRIYQISDKRVRQGFLPVKELMLPTVGHIQLLRQQREAHTGGVFVTGVPTGFDDIDKVTSGFQRGDLIIIAGRPSMGKTSFALNIAENAAILNGHSVAVLSLEMSKEQIGLRLLCSQVEVPLYRVRSGDLNDNEFRRLTRHAGPLYEAPILIDDSAAPTILEIRAKCRRLKSEGRLDLVIIDYLQLVRSAGPSENRVQEISLISRSLKALAKELDVPVVALSQLSRAVEQRADKDRHPQLSDLRESGALEQDADVVMFVYREEMYKKNDPEVRGKAEIIVAKQRNGPIADVKLTFLHEYTKFVKYREVTVGETAPDLPPEEAPF